MESAALPRNMSDSRTRLRSRSHSNASWTAFPSVPVIHIVAFLVSFLGERVWKKTQENAKASSGSDASDQYCSVEPLLPLFFGPRAIALSLVVPLAWSFCDVISVSSKPCAIRSLYFVFSGGGDAADCARVGAPVQPVLTLL